VSSQLQGARAFEKLKTIFLIVDSGMAIRNIVRTDAFAVLRACSNLRIVIFSPLTDEDFKKEAGGENVFFEPLQKWKPGPLVKTLRSFRKDIWSEKHDLTRFREKRSSGKGALGRAFVYTFLSRDRSERRIDRALEKLEALEWKLTPELGREYLEKYQPDLVLFSTVYSKDLSVELGARQRGITTCAYVVSWDNPTTKGPFPFRCDRAIVWNNIMRDELVAYHGFAPEHVCVSGPPQFDIYAQRSALLSRQEFFKKWSLDPAKKLITYTTGTVSLLPFDHEIIEMFYARMHAAFKQPCQLLVRLHPKDDPSVYKKFENKPDLVLQMPGRKGKTDDSWNPSRADMLDLAETLAHSDVQVNIASTITIEAACFDIPIVNVAFDGYQQLPYEKSCRRIYDFNHYKKIVATGGAPITQDLESTIAQIQEYLDNPRLHAEGRARIVSEQCYKFDGRAGERIGNYLVTLLGS
jgi:hypothetical protein